MMSSKDEEEREIEKALNEEYSESGEDDDGQSQGALSSRSGLTDLA